MEPRVLKFSRCEQTYWFKFDFKKRNILLNFSDQDVLWSGTVQVADVRYIFDLLNTDDKLGQVVKDEDRLFFQIKNLYCELRIDLNLVPTVEHHNLPSQIQQQTVLLGLKTAKFSSCNFVGIVLAVFLVEFYFV